MTDTTDTTDALVTAEDVATVLGVSTRTVHRLAVRDEMPSVMVGGSDGSTRRR